MGHGHNHQHGSNSRKLGVAFLLNLTFTVIEVIGGLWTNSIAILTDALHDFGDCASLASAWYFQRLSQKGRTASFTYGYGRFAVLGALITGLVLIAGLGFMLWHAIARLQSPEAVHAPGMIVLALAGILFNGAAVIRVRRGTSLTERVVSWHLLEDVLGWTAVLIGAVIMTFRDWPIVDPILSILISVFVLFNVGRNLRKVFAVFLQRAPHDFKVERFIRDVKELPGVRDVHHTHTWTIDGEHHVLTTHVVMPRKLQERKSQKQRTAFEPCCRKTDLTTSRLMWKSKVNPARQGILTDSPTDSDRGAGSSGQQDGHQMGIGRHSSFAWKAEGARAGVHGRRCFQTDVGGAVS